MLPEPYLSPRSESEIRPPSKQEKPQKIESESAELECSDDESDGIASKEKACTALEEAYKSTKDLQTIFEYRALNHIRFYFFDDRIKELTAADIVQEAVLLIITGKRKWNVILVPNIVNFVFMVIVSVIRNEKKKRNNHISLQAINEDGDIKQDGLAELFKESFRQDLETELSKSDYEILIAKCLKKLEDDIYASFVFEELIEDTGSNIKIAAKLKISVSEVEASKKRIKRKLKEIISKLKI